MILTRLFASAARRITGYLAFAFLALPFGASANLVITPTFDTTITSLNSSTRNAVESAINTAISNLESLYTNNVTIAVTFDYTNSGNTGQLEGTNQNYYDVSYSQYVSLLTADSAAHPSNTILSTALANLQYGNDSNGSKDLAVAGGLYAMLGGNPVGPFATVTLNSYYNFSFTSTVASNQYDAIGGLEHELDEVLGGGGAGSTLNSVAGSCTTAPAGFFCNKVGPTDLYRYVSSHTGTLSTLSTSTSYLSVNGGVTSIVGFNQNSSGDYGDFAPNGNGAGQLIQNAFNSTGKDETLTATSPETQMLQALGWDLATSTPEPGTNVLIGLGLLSIAAVAYRRRAKPTSL
jgi:hypothetical protein